ncbi:hypothetical protein Q3G72_010207 [Acer saccharum]|nr:hypothetical protein Q3G72_010207 [Acer saccharum]
MNVDLNKDLNNSFSTKRARAESGFYGRDDIAEEVSTDTSVDNVEKINSPYGPWLLVSYGKQGSKNVKGRYGRNGSGSSGGAEKSGNNGKVVGNDVKVLTDNTFSSSNCHNGKVVFTEITNQHGRLSEENARNFLTGTKKIFRRKDKPIMGGSQSVSVPSYHKGSTSAKGSVPNPVSKSVVEENVDNANVLR